eukprot:CAMPEP_0198229880 /NCGR_PEP_ID=MMETSP1445-20131203/114357_1 /TAXON_ID=36898 /ORGANISM="Pyramimonas sp., Strain CCMP2087" /LENGTH=367 /DNA_ID=CAMNT_0043910363 /DNA_START=340 /DNA_END=1443 /DNA_ORIENTATION=+
MVFLGSASLSQVQTLGGLRAQQPRLETTKYCHQQLIRSSSTFSSSSSSSFKCGAAISRPQHAFLNPLGGISTRFNAYRSRRCLRVRIKAGVEEAEIPKKLAHDGCQLALHYIGKAVETGITFQTTWDRPDGPMIYVLGSIQSQPPESAAVRIMQQLDNALLGMAEDSTKKITLRPEDAYGVSDPAMIMDIPLAAAKQAMGLAAESIAPGINIQLPDGRMAKVESTSANAIRVNLNHPLAGQEVEFEVFLMEVGQPGDVLEAQKESNLAMATVSHILVTDLQLCERLALEIAAGADLADLARQHSTCPSKADGGRLGTFSSGQMVPAFDAVVFDPTVEVGAVTGPVLSDFGYHLICVHERVLPNTPDC